MDGLAIALICIARKYISAVAPPGKYSCTP